MKKKFENEVYPLSFNQEVIWFDQVVHADIPLYNVGGYVRINGPVDAVFFEKALNRIIRENDALRIVLLEGQSLPTQTFSPYRQFKLVFHDFSNESNPHQRAARWMEDEFVKPFRLYGEFLFRFALLKGSENCYYWFINFHHLVADGWTLSLIVRQMAEAYNYFFNGERSHTAAPVTYSYIDFIKSDIEYVASEAYTRHEHFWLEKFKTLPERLILRRPGGDPREHPLQSGFSKLHLDWEFYNRLAAFAAEKNSSTAHVFLGLLYCYFSRTSGKDDVVVGLPTLNRSTAAFKRTTGLFVGVSPARFKIGMKTTVVEMIKAIGKELRGVYRHQRFPVNRIYRQVGLHKDKNNRQQLFDLTFSYEKWDFSSDFNGSPIEFITLANGFNAEALAAAVKEYHGAGHRDVRVEFVYNLNAFQPDEMDYIVKRLRFLLEKILENPGISARDLPIIPPGESREILYRFNRTEADYPGEKTIHQLFVEQVEKRPDHVALAAPKEETGKPGSREAKKKEDISVTYKELNRRSNQLAYLLMEKGVGSDTIVGIMVGRSVEMIIGILGILKAGGAYLPIDPEYPEERIDYMLKDSGANVLVTPGTLTQEDKKLRNLEVKGDIQTIFIDTCKFINFSFSQLLNFSSSHPSSLAYIIYTSGTTGKPKGVMITHRNLVRLLFNDRFQFDFSHWDTWTLFHSYCFDFSVWEMYGALLFGGRLVLVSKMGARDTAKFLELLKREGVTVLNQTPPAFYILMEQVLQSPPTALNRLRYVIFGGEVLQSTRLKKWQKKYPHVHLINMYGITETTVHVTFKEIGKKEIQSNQSNIGQPIPTLHLYIMDSNLNLLPIGVPGELCVSGAGLARGYLNNSGLTAERFIEIEVKVKVEEEDARELPEKNNQKFLRGESGCFTGAVFLKSAPVKHLARRRQKVYRSGDLARWLVDGDIEYLGRIDHQVKVRGFRVELGEIQHVLASHPHIDEVVVTAGKDKENNGYLVAYYRGTAGFPVPEPRQFLANRLPDYMVPSFFIPLERLPLTPSGKVLRSALPDPGEIVTTGKRYQAPLNWRESRLMEIWLQVLDVKQIGIHDNFFELGGHSLKGINLVSKAEKALKVSIPLAVLFEKSTIYQLSQYIEDAQASAIPGPKPVEKRDYYPLSAAQFRLFTVHQLEKTSTSYNMPAVFTVVGALVKSRLNAVMDQLVKRHEAFRTSFFILDGQPAQRVYEREEIAPYILYHDESRDITGLEDQMIRASIRPFDLSTAPLSRVEVWPLGPDRHLMMWDIHHIISDGTSLALLVKKFSRLYDGHRPEPLHLQYKDYSVWQQEVLAAEGVLAKEENYWLDRFKGGVPLLDMPLDFPRPSRQRFAGDHLSFTIDQSLAHGLHRLARKNNATLFMVLLAAYNVLLYRYTGQEDIVVGCGTANRQHADLQDMVGMFVNMLVMRNFPASHQSFIQFLQEVKEYSIAAFENQGYQFDTLVEKLNIERDPSRNPIFDVSFVLQNMEFQEMKTESLQFTPREYQFKTSKFDLFLEAEEINGTIRFVLEYCTKLFKKESMERLSGHYLNILEEVVACDGSVAPGDIQMVPAEEKRQLLFEFNDTETAFPSNKAICRLFEEQVDRTPDNIAVVGPGGDSFVTYRHLDEKANQLTHFLAVEQAVVPDTLVGILMERCLDLITAIMGVLKAGGAYLPLDPGLPEDRIKMIIDDSSLRVIVSGRRHIKILNKLQWECRRYDTYICMDSEDIYGEDEVEKNQLMDEKLWRHVGETAVDEITGGGWKSSYTGEDLSTEEMAEYAGNIFEKLEPYLNADTRVLEIGCASGISMFKIVPHVGFYYGTDLSEVIIEKNQRRVIKENIKNIKLKALAAHQVDTLVDKDFDIIIMNSVIQCFHGHNYLRRVFIKALSLLRDRGIIFFGDIMDLNLKGELLRSLEGFKRMYAGEGYVTKTDLSSELFVSRGFFEDLAVDIARIKSVTFSNKIHTIENELTKFRYDAIIGVEKKQFKHKRGGHRKKHKYQFGIDSLFPYGKERIQAGSGPGNLAYAIYTSGSTGKPKGVLIEQHSVLNLVFAQKKKFNIIESERVLQFSPFYFDASVEQIFITLLSSAVLVLVDETTILDMDAFEKYISRHSITHLHAVPSFLEVIPERDYFSLRRVVSGGDICSPSLARRWNKFYDFYNEYGPTETTVTSIELSINPGGESRDVLSIGRPIANTTVHILDKQMQLYPPGAAGELYIGGEGLARGYLNRPELTVERFVIGHSSLAIRKSKSPIKANDQCPMTNDRIYRTGDLARWLADGNIEFLGRIDFQVKIRGYRIELGEIENILLMHGNVKETAVTTRKYNDGNNYLSAYIVPDRTHGAWGMEYVGELRGFLSKQLPHYMIPSFFIPMEKLPLTAIGKIDRNALPDPMETLQSPEDYQPPTTGNEKQLAQLWREVLGVKRIGIMDNFFEHGGHSLRAINLVSKIKQTFRVEFPLPVVFQRPFIREQAAYIEEARALASMTVEPLERRYYYPVSAAQKRLYALNRMAPHDINYNMSGALHMKGQLSRIRIEGVIRGLVLRHESLRTSFHLIGDQPVQRVHDELEFEIDYLATDEGNYKLQNTRPLSIKKAGAETNPNSKSQIKKDKETGTHHSFVRPFDLSLAPLLRVVLVKQAADLHLLLVDMHHIISDGLSIEIFIKEFSRLYNRESLPPLKLQYKEYAAWQQVFLRSESLVKQQAYWKEKFQGEIPVLNIPVDYPRPALQSFAGDTLSFEIDEKLTRGLHGIAGEANATLYIVLLTVYNILLHRYTGREDIIVGSPAAGRRHADFNHIMGMFVNTLAMRNFPRPHKKSRDFLQEVKENCLQAFENQDYQFHQLVEELEVKRDIGRSPLFDTMFALQNLENPGFAIKGLEVNIAPLDNTVSNFDITLQCWEEDARLGASVEYAVKLFKKETMQRFVTHFVNILREIVENPGIKLAQINMLSREEEQQLLYEFNNTATDYPGDKTIHQLFEEQAGKTPDNIAIAGALQIKNRTYMTYTPHISYHELNEKSNRQAHLLTGKGVRPDIIVGLMMERSIEMIVGILGILKSGGAYLPIDPEYPEDRIDYMLKDSGAKILLSAGHHPDLPSFPLPSFSHLHLQPAPATSVSSSSTSTCQVSPANLAYVIYTSGTTGRPKGVMVNHRGLVNLKAIFAKRYHVTAAHRVLQFASISFDASISEFFMSLFAGACLVLMPGELVRDHRRFEAYVEKHAATVVTLPPGYLEYLDPVKLRTLKVLITAGSAARAAQVRRWHRRVCYINGYGPTEATICASLWEAPSKGEIQYASVPIGIPLSNTRTYILDTYGNLQPIGVTGELYISGVGIARGYLNQPGLTNDKFCLRRPGGRFLKKLPPRTPRKNFLLKVPGNKINMSYMSHMSYFYKTGDLARWLIDGNIEFLGRIDTQVKIRGYRIELGEIEHVILSHHGINEAVVQAREDKDGNLYLAAYYVGKPDHGKLSVPELQEFLVTKLPHYMTPLFFVSLERLPVTSSGKIDEKALPEPKAADQKTTPYQPPAAGIERILVEIWQDVLGVEPIGTTDRFFELGGDSIKAIQVASRLLKYDLQLDIADLFKHLTIRGISPGVKKIHKKIDQATVSGEVKLTPIQHWFFERNFIHRHHWNQAVMLYKHDRFNEEIATRILEKIVLHHDALRMVYPGEGGKVPQYNRGPDGELFTFDVFDLRGRGAYEGAIEKEANGLQGSIDLAKGPLVKVGLFKTADGDHLLLIIHHLVIDGVSWRILLEDFSIAYRQAIDGQSITLPQKTTSFRVWAESLYAFAQHTDSQWFSREIACWKSVEEHHGQPLPKDKGTSQDQEKLGDSETFFISLTAEETGCLLRDVHRPYRTEINDILLTSLGLAVREWTGREEISVNLEGHGREALLDHVHMDITRTVGWFTSQYPVVLSMKYSRDLAFQLRNIKETLRQIPHKGIGYGILEYLYPGEKKPLEFSLKPEISFNYLGQLDHEADGEIFSISPLSTGHSMSLHSEKVFPLEIGGIIRDGRLTLDIVYSRNCYRRQTIEKLAETYKTHLLTLIDHCLQTPADKFCQYRASIPADYGMAGLSISRLDEIKEKLRKEVDEKAVIQKIYPLSPMQEGILFHSLMQPDDPLYVEQYILEMEGALDPQVFEKSLNNLVQRHDVLRTLFIFEKLDKPLQVVLEHRGFHLYFENISHLPGEEKDIFTDNAARKDIERRFDLTRDMLLRVSIFQESRDRFKILWTFHHIILDGWCQAILFSEFFSFYRADKNSISPTLDPVYPYVDHIKWLEKQDRKKALSFWRIYLENYTRQTPLSQIGRGLTRDKYYPETLSFTLGKEKTKEMAALAAINQVTLNVVFNCLWGVLLARYNNTGDVVFGSVVSGRSPELPGIEKMVGLFINTIPVRIRPPGHISFSQLLKKTRDEALEAGRYDWFPLVNIQAAAELKQDLLDHIIIFENYPLDEEIKDLGLAKKIGLSLKHVEVIERTNYDFTVSVIPGDQFEIRFDYNCAVYAKEVAGKIKNHLLTILEQVLAAPGIRATKIKILTPGEEKQLLYEFNNTGTDYPKDKTIHQLFAEQMERTPDHVALVGPKEEAGKPGSREAKKENISVTYKELNRKSNRLAYLLIEKGVRPDTIVGLMVPRCVEMIMSLLGILKAGGAYLPIDPEFPPERINYVLTNSSTSVLLTTRILTEETGKLRGYGGENIFLDKGTVRHLSRQYVPPATCCLPPAGNSTHHAYVIYTSGSTGNPKGVVVRHQNAVNFIKGMTLKIDFHWSKIILALTTLSFDIFFLETLLPVTCGMKVIIADETRQKDPVLIAQLINDYHVNMLQVTPSHLKLILGVEDNLRCLARVEQLIVGGEVFPPYLFASVKEKFPGKIYNIYGPTETTIWSTVKDLSNCSPGKLNIGGPIANTRVYIVDGFNMLQPVGAAGEMLIGGIGTASGYLNNPELTSGKFIRVVIGSSKKRSKDTNDQCPMTNDRFYKDSNDSLYRTGDLARWLPHGEIEFFGRLDYQVKIRGFRVELEEVEEQLTTHKNIKEAVVTAVDSKTDGQYLCAYIVPTYPGMTDLTISLPVEQIRGHLSRKLPDYMIPSRFIPLECIPLTANGKIDRKALPEPKTSIGVGTAVEYTAPSNSTEKQLVKVWREVLGIERIGTRHHFFRLGGHSLKAITLVSKIKNYFQVDLPLRVLFEKPTIKEQAEHIEHSEICAFAAAEPVEKREYYPVSAAQRRLFAIDHFDQEGVSYNMPGAVRIEGDLSTPAAHLEKVFKTLISCHESLRTSFHLIDDRPIQKVHDAVEFKLEYYDLAADKENYKIQNTKYKQITNYKSQITNKKETKGHHSPFITHNSFVRPFDLSRAPLMRIALIKETHQKHIILFDMHHIISDGVSMDIFVREFSHLYAGRESTELPLHYKDFATWQNSLFQSEQVLKQKVYWVEKFSAGVPVLNMPLDFQRPAVQSFEGDHVEFEIDEELTEGLKRIAGNNEATLYMVLLSVYNILLWKYSGQDDIVVGSAAAGRRHACLDNIIGMFVNTLAMRNHPQFDKSYEEFLKEVKPNSLEAFENQDYQFDDLVEQLGLTRDAGRNPLFDAMFVMQNLENREPRVEGLEFKHYELENKISKFDITLRCAEHNGRIDATLDYCIKLYKKETMSKFAGHFVNIVKEIVANPGIKLVDINMLSEEEEKQLLYEFNAAKADYPQDKTIHELFAEQSGKSPNHVALVGPKQEAGNPGTREVKKKEDISVTYKELNRKSIQLAHLLIEKGVRPDTTVGIMVERSVEMIVGILGILKAGGAYLPIDPEYPEEKKEYMLADSSANVLVTSSTLAQEDKKLRNLEVKRDIQTIFIDTCKFINFSFSQLLNFSSSHPSSLAYVIYTSGSTGKPKGVMIQNNNLVNYVCWFANKASFTADDNVILTTTISFDAGYTYIFASLLKGGRLHIIAKEVYLTPEKFLNYTWKNKITFLKLIPSLFTTIVNSADFSKEKLQSVRLIMLGGEAIHVNDVEKAHSICSHVQFMNHYGPTEVTIGCVARFIDFTRIEEYKHTPTIGQPILNIKAYILDNHGNLQPVGITGELCIAGKGLARGYLNRPELTAEKFDHDLQPCSHETMQVSPYHPPQYPITPSPHHPIYRTGDLARWLIDGNIEFLGRVDNQVKIRGNRVELGEVEHVLLNHEKIEEAVLSLGKDSENHTYLCAYFVSTGELPVLELRAYLAHHLPDYMIPAYFVPIDRIPLTPNGKIDRKALPESLDGIKTGKAAPEEKPTNPTEERLVEVWQKVLGIEEIGVHHNFFQLGGDSIKAIRISSWLQKHGLRLTVKDLFEHRTIAAISPFVESTTIRWEQGVISGDVKLTPIQHWFFESDFTDSHHWNQAIMIYKSDRFDEAIVEKVLTRIVEHHDALRMIYPIPQPGESSREIQCRTGRIRQVRQYNRGITGELLTFRLWDFTRETDYTEKVEQKAVRLQGTINLGAGPLVKVGLFKTPHGDHLLLAVHHLVIDSVSWRILLEDFTTGYRQAQKGEHLQFSDKTTSFKAWSEKLHQYAASRETQVESQQEMAYWEKIENTPVPPLPRDKPAPVNRMADTLTLAADFTPAETNDLLKNVHQAYNTEINDILLAALGLAIHRWKGIERIRINLEGHGRETIIPDVDINRTIGWFTTHFPVILEVEAANDISLHIKQVKETLRRIPSRGIGYGILRSLLPRDKENHSFPLNPAINFNYLGQFSHEMTNDLFTLSDLSPGETTGLDSENPYTLNIIGVITGGKLNISFRYNKQEYNEATISPLVDNYRKCLLEIIRHCLDKDTNESTLSDFSAPDLDEKEIEAIYDLLEDE